MYCNRLLIPGSESSRFYIHHTTKMPIADPIPRVKLPTRVHVRSFKTKATINDGVATAGSGMSFYELLGIPQSVTLPEIKRAYKQLARKYHPDVSPPDRVKDCTQRFIQVQEAYETLSDPERRALYDRRTANGLHLAFSARRRYDRQNDMEMEAMNEWTTRWQSQLSQLKRRSASNVANGNMSWVARMRRQREEVEGVLF